MILFSKINRFLSSTTHGSIRTDLIKKMNYNYKTRFKFYLFLYPLLILTRIPFKRRVYCPIENGDEVTIITLTYLGVNWDPWVELFIKQIVFVIRSFAAFWTFKTIVLYLIDKYLDLQSTKTDTFPLTWLFVYFLCINIIDIINTFKILSIPFYSFIVCIKGIVQSFVY